MKAGLIRWGCRWVLVLALVLPAAEALGQRRGDPQREPIDARMEGYETNVSMEERTAGMSWLILSILGALAFAGLFKDARRTHLD